MKKKSSELNSMIYYFFIYVPLGAVCPLLSQYLSSIGFSGTEVGIVTSLSTLGATIGSLALGKLYSNGKKKRLMIGVIILCCSITSTILWGVKTFIPFSLLYMLLYFFQEPVHGLSDSMINQSGKKFSVIRAFGAIGYAVASFVTGLICEKYSLSLIFPIHASMYLISSIFLFQENEPKNYVEEKKDKVKILTLFKEPRFVKLLICTLFAMGIEMSNNTYFGYLYREAGGNYSGIGLAFLLMAGSESIFMALLPKLEKHLKMEKIIIIGFVTEIIRFGLYSLGPSTKVLLGTFFLQGIMGAVLLVELVKYFSFVVEPKYAAMSICIFNAIGINFSTILTNLLGGIVLDSYGAKGVYLSFTILATIGLVLYILLGLHKEEGK